MKHKQFEYITESFPLFDYLDELNKLGKKGWELVDIQITSGISCIVCILKREKLK